MISSNIGTPSKLSTFPLYSGTIIVILISAHFLSIFKIACATDYTVIYMFLFFNNFNLFSFVSDNYKI